MAQVPIQLFQLGNLVITADGRQGTITAIRISEDAGEDGGFWEYLLDPLFEFFAESSLTLGPPEDIIEDPLPPPPPPPPDDGIEDLLGGPGVPQPEDFVTFKFLQDFVLTLLQTQPQVGVSQAALEDALVVAVNSANLTAQANLGAHIADVEDAAVSSAAQFQQLESAVTTTLSEIEKRATELEATAEESSGIGFFGFVGGLGGLIKNPVDWIMSRLGDHISSEVNDGLNR